jgi:hypothetical protein
VAKETKLAPCVKDGTRTLAELQRAVRSFRHHPPHHPQCEAALSKAHARLAAFHSKHGCLALEVTAGGLVLEGEALPPLQRDTHSEGLDSLLVQAGFREVAIDKGIEISALGRLLQIFAAHNPRGDELAFADDLLTGLWREDLQGVEYQVHDPLAPALVDRTRDADPLGAIAARIRFLVDDLGGRLEQTVMVDMGGAGQPLSASAFLVQLNDVGADADDVASWSTRADKSREYLDTEAGVERRRLVDELFDPRVSDSLGRAAQVVAWAAQGGLPVGALVADEDAEHFLSASTLHALSRGDLELATRLAQVAIPSPGVRSAMGAAVAACLSLPEGIAALARTLEARAGSLSPEALLAEGLSYLGCLGAGAVEGVVAHFPDLGDESARAVFREFLIRNLEQGASAVAGLTRHEDEDVVRDAIHMLAGSDKGSRAFGLLQEIARSPEGGVATEFALEFVDQESGESDRRRLVETLSKSHSPGDREDALADLQEHATQQTYTDLLPLVEGDELLGRSENEVKAILDLMIRAGGARASRGLQQLSERRTPLFRRRAETERLKEIASEKLGDLRRRLEGGGGD